MNPRKPQDFVGEIALSLDGNRRSDRKSTVLPACDRRFPDAKTSETLGASLVFVPLRREKPGMLGRFDGVRMEDGIRQKADKGDRTVDFVDER